MDTLTWDEVVESSKAPPRLEELSDYIFMKGMLDVEVNPHQETPAEIFDIASDIEEKLRDAYPKLTFVAEESERTPLKGYSNVYWGQIYGSDESGVVVKIRIDASKIDGRFSLTTKPTFFAVFPLGDYFDQTNRALKEIWKHIAGCERILFPNEDSGVPKEKRGNQTILLYQGGKPVAIGEYALQDSGLEVEPKEPILGEDGILI
ncbi:hypothetical protein JW707_00485 [Candidatus Woesearchaeota archaeon]|nr:hypothetical protein [Candidatus Woesearchaeota archaeon]